MHLIPARDVNAQRLFDELFFFRFRIQQINPESFGGFVLGLAQFLQCGWCQTVSTGFEQLDHRRKLTPAGYEGTSSFWFDKTCSSRMRRAFRRGSIPLANARIADALLNITECQMLNPNKKTPAIQSPFGIRII